MDSCDETPSARKSLAVAGYHLNERRVMTSDPNLRQQNPVVLLLAIIQTAVG